jgi:glycosyltransferase involved in cell wall biosynthesis
MVDIADVSVLLYGVEGDRNRMQTAFEDRVKEIQVMPPPIPWKGARKRYRQITAYLRGRSGGYAYAHSSDMQKEVQRMLERTSYDIIQCETHLMSIFDTSRSDAVRILDTQNVEHDGFTRLARHSRSVTRRLFYKHEAKASYREETEAWRNQDAILCTSRRDYDIIDRHVPSIQKFVIPNGVDVSYFSPGDDGVEPFSMAFTGTMNYPPNTDGMLFFLDRVFPEVLKSIPQAKLYVVGSAPPRELQRRSSQNIVVTGFVDDVRPFIRRAGVYVVPLQSGGGTRLKLLEALAMRKPVVTTSVGCEGIDVIHNESVMIADDPDEFAATLIELLRVPARGFRLAENGHEIVRRNYDWSLIGPRLQEAYRSALSGRHGTIEQTILT